MKTRSTFSITPHRAALLAFLLMSVAFLSSGRAGTFTEFTGTSALPGQNPNITTVSTDGSAVAFAANLNTAAGVAYQAIYYVGSSGVAPKLIADTLTTQSPTGGGVFTDFNGVVVHGSVVVFQADVQTSQTQNGGIYIAQVGGALSVAADSNTTNPLDPTGDLTGDSKLNKTYVGFDFQGSNIIFINGANLFKTTVAGGSADVVALLPLNPNTPAGVPFADFNSVNVAGNTYVAYGTDANNHSGIYSGNIGGGAQTKIADNTTAQPTGKGNFDVFGNPMLTLDGTFVVFDGYVNGSNTGIYSAPSKGGTITAVALVGETKPAGGTFNSSDFADLQSEGDLRVDFSGDGTIYSTGLGGGGSFVSVLASGDSLGGKTVTFAGFTGGHSEDFALQTDGGAGGVQTIYAGTSGSTQYQTPAFFTGQVALANGVYYLSFPNGNYFGYYSFLSDPHYIYHFDLGYEYVFDAADGKSGVYLYDFKSKHFFYTSPTFPFPYLYDFTLKTVLYYYPDPKNKGHYDTNGIRYFYDFATKKIISE